MSFGYPVTYSFELNIFFYTHICFFCIIIFFIIIFIILNSIFKNKNHIKSAHNENFIIENLFILVPFLIVLAIALPSFSLIYSESQNFLSNVYTVNGNQWFWAITNHNSQYSKDFSLNCDIDKNLYNVESYNRELQIRCLSNDVIHAIWFPVLGMKIDAIPGSVNIINTSIKFTGLFTGKCAEYCGLDHYNMPIFLYSN